jgi:hypothetical protein
MSLDGVYGFVYCGTNDLGIGAFIIEGGRVRGVDYGGGRYTGVVTESAGGEILVDVSFDVPAGMVLVQGTAPQDLPHTRSIKQTFPPKFGDGKPFQASTPPVTVMVRRLPGDSRLPGLLGLQ